MGLCCVLKFKSSLRCHVSGMRQVWIHIHGFSCAKLGSPLYAGDPRVICAIYTRTMAKGGGGPQHEQSEAADLAA